MRAGQIGWEQGAGFEKKQKTKHCNADGWTVLSQEQTVPIGEFFKNFSFLKFRSRVIGSLKSEVAGAQQAVAFMLTSQNVCAQVIQKPYNNFLFVNSKIIACCKAKFHQI